MDAPRPPHQVTCPAAVHARPGGVAALAASPVAASAFESLSKTNQYAVILDVVTARTPKTRAAHIHKAITALELRGQ